MFAHQVHAEAIIAVPVEFERLGQVIDLAPGSPQLFLKLLDHPHMLLVPLVAVEQLGFD